MTPFFYNHKIDKSELKRIIRWYILHYGPSEATLFLDKIKVLGFHSATLSGLSLGIEDLKTAPTKSIFIHTASNKITKNEAHFLWGQISPSERFARIIEVWTTTSEILKDDVVSYFQETDPLNSLYVMAFSGARGNISQVRQLVGMRGLMSDPKGQIIDRPIQSNFREGLRVSEYMISCYGARKGLVDTALGTAHAGYLTRRLVDVAHAVLIDDIDCQTSNGVFFQKPQEGDLLGRVSAESIFRLPTTLKDSQARKDHSSMQLEDVHSSTQNLNTFPEYLFLKRNEDIGPILSRDICKIFQKNESHKAFFHSQPTSDSLYSLSSSQFLEDGLFIRSPLTCESF